MKGPRLLLAIAAYFLLVVTSEAQSAGLYYIKYVNPFIGTGAVDAHSLSGANFPGTTLPFAFVQLSPDTEESPDDPASGYDYNANSIVGFSHTHLSGTGVSDLLDILMMPTTGDIYIIPGSRDRKVKGYRSAFLHTDEKAEPSYYKVLLKDYNITAELTSTEHVGLHRYTFPKSGDAHIIFDLDHSLNKKRNYWACKIIQEQIRVVNDHTIEGYRILTGWAPLRKVYFRAEFSKPFKSVLLANGNGQLRPLSVLNGNALKAAVNFDESATVDPVLVKVALSPVSQENTALNMSKELPGWDFESVVATGQQLWEKELRKLKIEGSDKQKTIFYTALYHAYTQPNNIADVNGQYMATDYTIKKAEDNVHYSTFSLWDTYRAAHPLYTLTQPEKTGAFVNSMLRQYQTFGFLPIWQLWGQENYCMIGNHAIPVIVDAVMKGIKGFNIDSAYAAVKNSSLRDHQNAPFSVLNQYKYFPEDIQSQSVSLTLEIAYNDWCVAQLAKYLGKMDDYNFFAERSMNYRNLFNSANGFFQAKDKDGKWREPFDPMSYGGNGGSPYTEANAWQYLWYVPQNVPDLIRLMGGKDLFEKKLDQFFTLEDTSAAKNGNASGFIGQYAHGNEPSQHVGYFYDYIGKPWKTQYYVAKVLNEQYMDNSAGYTGNDDCGQMSAWYVFSAMGFYPVNPANGIYAIGSPILKQAEITSANGKVFKISAQNAGGENIYIQSVKYNGRNYDKTYITQQMITAGGTLEFKMGKKPNRNWGIKDLSVPPVWGF